MIRLGVRRFEDYRAAPPRGLVGRWRHRVRHDRLSYELLRVQMPASPEQIVLFESIMHELMLESGVYRTTFRGRFRGFDEELTELLRGRFDPSCELRVEDWAASDCLTSAEWAGVLFDAFPKAHLRASDRTLDLVLARVSDGEAYVLERDGFPLQYLRGPFVVWLQPPEGLGLPLHWLLCRRALSRLRARSWQIPAQWLDSPSSECAVGPVRFEKISVVHPEAALLASRDRRFAVERHSVFEALDAPAHVIRTMNIFNNGYFKPELLAQGAHAVWRSMRPGGVWIVGRTGQVSPPTQDATLFERTADGFVAIHRTGKGSEIEALVLEQRWR